MPRVCQVSSVMGPMLDITDSIVRSASCVCCCTTDKPNSDGALHDPGEAEYARDSARYRAKVEFGATDEEVVELPTIRPLWRVEVVVCGIAVTTPNLILDSLFNGR